MTVLRREGTGGAYELWAAGWHIKVPGNGGRPAAVKGEPPTDAVTDDQTLREDGDIKRLRVGGWMLQLLDEEVLVVAVKPRRTDGPSVRLYRQHRG